jgi:Protein of unknown function (DUF3363)
MFGDDISPQPGMIVALTGSGGKSKMRNTQIEVVSTWSVEKLRSVEAPTWLDQTIVADKRPVIRATGFGADVAKAIVAREDWLIANGLAQSDTPGTFTPRPDLLQDLRQRAVTRIAATLATEYQLPHIPLIEGRRITGQHIRTIDMPLQRLAVIKGRSAFTLVPWRPELAKMQGRDIEISMQNQQITMTLARGRSRDLGLSRSCGACCRSARRPT